MPKEENATSDIKNILVIGASAGGTSAISQLLSGLSPSMDIAVLVVLHVSRKSNPNIIGATFQKKTLLKCKVAQDGWPLQRGYAYIAPPEHQLMVKRNKLCLTQGTHENKYRPSIDVLFRSAAVNFGHRTIGVILTGLLEDGTSGMWAIKQCGGICIVQDPEEAQFSDMPRSVINKIKVDYIGTLEVIPDIIKLLSKKNLPEKIPVPHELRAEADITEKMMSDIIELRKIADHSDFTCPDCGGQLWKIKNDPTNRYRCHTGHVYGERLLAELQSKNIEESVWVAIRMLEEKQNLMLLMAKRNSDQEEPEAPSYHYKRIQDIELHIKHLKSLLMLLLPDMRRSDEELGYTL